MASKSEFFDWYDKNFAEGDRKIQDLIDTLSQRGPIKANSDSAGRSLQEKNAARPKGTPSRAPGVKGPLAAGRGPLIPGKKASAKKPLGIDDPEIRARLNAAKAKREAAPTAAAPPKGVHYDQPPLVFRLFGHSSDPNEFTGEPNLGPRLSPQTKKGAPLPRYEMQAPRNPERERRMHELAPKGEGITRAGQPGARSVSSKRLGSRVEKDNAVKRLQGKRPVKRGEI